MSSVFVLCNLLQKWVCYACPKFWKFLPECTVSPCLSFLWIKLGGKRKWLPLNFGYHDKMHPAPLWPQTIKREMQCNVKIRNLLTNKFAKQKKGKWSVIEQFLKGANTLDSSVLRHFLFTFLHLLKNRRTLGETQGRFWKKEELHSREKVGCQSRVLGKTVHKILTWSNLFKVANLAEVVQPMAIFFHLVTAIQVQFSVWFFSLWKLFHLS